MANRKFHKDDLDEYRDSDDTVSYEYVESRRWYDVFELVFSHEGKLYRVDYMAPATEIQEGQDRWIEDSNGMVDCEEVEPYPVTVTKYRKVA